MYALSQKTPKTSPWTFNFLKKFFIGLQSMNRELYIKLWHFFFIFKSSTNWLIFEVYNSSTIQLYIQSSTTCNSSFAIKTCMHGFVFGGVYFWGKNKIKKYMGYLRVFMVFHLQLILDVNMSPFYYGLNPCLLRILDAHQ